MLFPFTQISKLIGAKIHVFKYYVYCITQHVVEIKFEIAKT